MVNFLKYRHKQGNVLALMSTFSEFSKKKETNSCRVIIILSMEEVLPARDLHFLAIM